MRILHKRWRNKTYGVVHTRVYKRCRKRFLIRFGADPELEFLRPGKKRKSKVYFYEL